MKKLYCIILAITIASGLKSQTPQAVQYQAVVRGSDGEVLKNQQVGYEISILSGSISGTPVYTETHIDTTDSFGVSNLVIGKGSPVTGTFDNIDWGNDSYFVKVSIDIYGGTSYTVMGTSQLMSVPYALYAEDANTLDGKTSSYFATASHTHTEYAPVSHTHAPSTLLPIAQGNIRFDGTCVRGCNNVESITWNSTYNRYEIEITDFYYSVDDIAMVTISGDSGSCPAGSDARQTSVGGILLIYIVDAAGVERQCSFNFVAFRGQ
jgi:hypothetical protein